MWVSWSVAWKLYGVVSVTCDGNFFSLEECVCMCVCESL